MSAEHADGIARTPIEGGRVAGVDIPAGVAYGRGVVTWRDGMSYPIALHIDGGMTIGDAQRLADELAAAIRDAQAAR